MLLDDLIGTLFDVDQESYSCRMWLLKSGMQNEKPNEKSIFSDPWFMRHILLLSNSKALIHSTTDWSQTALR